MVVDRMDESLVVLAWLLKVKLTDMLSSSAKKYGSWKRINSPKQYVFIVPRPKADDIMVQEFLQSPKWQNKHAEDLWPMRRSIKRLIKVQDEKALSKTWTNFVGFNNWFRIVVKTRLIIIVMKTVRLKISWQDKVAMRTI
jgi:hypothetical protein